MPPLPSPPDTRSKLGRALGIGGVAFCVLLAIGVAALFLPLMSARKAGGAERPSGLVAEGYRRARPLPLRAARRGVDPRSAPQPLVANLATSERAVGAGLEVAAAFMGMKRSGLSGRGSCGRAASALGAVIQLQRRGFGDGVVARDTARDGAATVGAGGVGLHRHQRP